MKRARNCPITGGIYSQVHLTPKPLYTQDYVDRWKESIEKYVEKYGAFPKGHKGGHNLVQFAKSQFSLIPLDSSKSPQDIMQSHGGLKRMWYEMVCQMRKDNIRVPFSEYTVNFILGSDYEIDN